VRDAGEAVELHVVLVRDACKPPGHAFSKIVGIAKALFEAVDRGVGRGEERRHTLVRPLRAPRLDGRETLAHFGDQRRTALGIRDELVFDIRIAADDPDIPEHFIKHLGRPARAPLTAQRVQRFPRRLAEQAHDDLAIGERRVVVGYFAKPGRHEGSVRPGRAMRFGGGRRMRYRRRRCR
jgi:hypothetical protein